MRSTILCLIALGVVCLLPIALLTGCATGNGNVLDQPHLYVTDRTTNRLIQMDNFQGDNWTDIFGKRGSNFNSPRKIHLDSAGRIYVADTDNHRIVRMDDMNGVGFVALGSEGHGAKQFSFPAGVFVDSSGHIYVADSGNNRIVRMDDMNGTNWTEFGSNGSLRGQFQTPSAIGIDRSGRIYIADRGNLRIVRIDDMNGNGWITYDNNREWQPIDIVLDDSNRIYVCDFANRQVVRINSMSGESQVAYNQLQGAFALAIGPDRKIYIADVHGIARIDDMSGAGRSAFGLPGKGIGAFQVPYGVCLDASGRIYVSDLENSRLVRINNMSGAGWVATDKGVTDPFADPGGVFALREGNQTSLYLSDTSHHRLVRTDIKGSVWETLGSQGSGDKQFSFPTGIFVVSSNEIYVADTGNQRIVRINGVPNLSVFRPLGSQGSGAKQFSSPTGVFVDRSGHIYVADTGNNRIVRMDDINGVNWKSLYGSADSTQAFKAPQGVCMDDRGRLYVADTGSNRIVRVDDMDGNGWQAMSTPGAGTPLFNHPNSIVRDTKGATYIADTGNQRIVRINDITGGGISFAGNVAEPFQSPYGIAVTDVERGPATGAGIAAPDFTIAVTPSPASVLRGGSSVDFTISLTEQHGFSGVVVLSVTLGSTPGLALTGPNPASVTVGSGTATAHFQVQASATAPDIATLTLTGVSGSLTRTAQVTLNMTTSSSAGGKIVFESQTSNGALSHILLMNADGSHLINLTDGTTVDRDPRFSSDGQWVVFSRDNGGSRDIWQVRADGSGLAKITPDGLPSASTNNVTPSFSPDGRQILFLGGDSFNPRITLMDRDGSRAHFLTSRPIFPQNTPVFSPEGTAIAFAGRLTAGQEIYTINLMNADGSQVRAIPNTTGLDVRSPRFSRDGRQIMFSTFLYSETRIKRDIYLIDVSGSALRGLTHDGESFAPAFTGSGRIVFVSTKTGGSDIYVMDANGQNATRLTSTAADTFDGSPDSQ